MYVALGRRATWGGVPPLHNFKSVQWIYGVCGVRPEGVMASVCSANVATWLRNVVDFVETAHADRAA